MGKLADSPKIIGKADPDRRWVRIMSTGEKFIADSKKSLPKLGKDLSVSREYRGFFLPETEIEIPESLSGLLYPLEKIHEDPSNPRKTEDLKLLVESIKRFGMRTPLLVNASSMTLEAGHQRTRALIFLGVKYAPMVFVHDDSITAAAYNIADNRTSELVAKWDDVALTRIYNVLKEEDALTGVGFDDDSLEELRMSLAESELDGMDGFGREHEQRGKDLQKEHGGKNKGDGYWFYVEYYGQGEKFAELKALLSDFMTTDHEIDPEFFEAMVRKNRE